MKKRALILTAALTPLVAAGVQAANLVQNGNFTDI